MILGTSTGDPLIDLLLNGTPYAILVAIIIAFFTGRILPGKQVEKQIANMETKHDKEIAQLREERDTALAFVRTQAEIAQRALEVSEKVKG